MKDRSPYFEKALDWATDARLRESRLRRTAWTVAGIATAIALLEAVALAMLTPLKTVEPITLLVDRQTGYVQALDPMQPRRVGADAALTQSFLAQYVTAREGFDRATVSADYRRVALWSAGLARSQYLSVMPASNPDSPLARYPGGTTIVARVKSVSPLSDGVALVRFDTERRDRSGAVGPAQSWISVVRYHYSDGAMALEDRLINPLGFQVVGYRRDAETPAPQPSQIASADQKAVPTALAQVAVIPSRTPGAISGQTSAFNRADGRESVRNMPLNQIPLGSPLVGRPAYAQTMQSGQP